MSMKPLHNPYTPNAGARPIALVGRDDQLESFDLLLARLQRGRPEQSMIITGLRGVGKTVLLGAFRDKTLEADWVPVEMEASKYDDDHFREELFFKLRIALFELAPGKKWGDRMRRAAQILSSFSLTFDPSGNVTLGADIEPFRGRGDTGILSLDITELLVTLGEAAQEANRGLVLLIDEIQFLSRPQLEALITALHKTIQRSLPITLVGAGLPQIAELAGDAKSYSERLFKFVHIGSLDDDESRRAFVDPAREEGAEFSPDALDEVVAITDGYPYFIQELGSSLWAVAEASPFTMDDVKESFLHYQSKLDDSFFRVRFDRATPLQAAYLRAMAELGAGPHSAADVAAVMKRTSQSVGPTRAQLIDMGLLYTPRFGFADFTVPHFDDFMKREMPVLEVPEHKTRSHRRRKSSRA